MKIQVSEAEIQKSVIAYLQYKRYYVIRLQSGMRIGEHNGKSWAIKLGEAGTPDLMAFKSLDSSGRGYTITYFLEIKRPGKKATEIQQAKMKELIAHGAKCLVIHDIKELEALGI